MGLLRLHFVCIHARDKDLCCPAVVPRNPTLVHPTNNQDYLSGQQGTVDHLPSLVLPHTTPSRGV
jgi:hypothetical protein